MIWIDFVIIVILVFSFMAGVKAGLVNSIFSLIIFLIALVVAGYYYIFVSSMLSFLPGENWSKFFGFVIAIVIISIILSIVCVIPRALLKSIWNGGGFFGLVGGVFNLVNTSIGFVVFIILLQQYPIVPFLSTLFAKSYILMWLTSNLSFIYFLLPVTFRSISN
jgi:uncharacterized membrane protein required for colicin V production